MGSPQPCRWHLGISILRSHIIAWQCQRLPGWEGGDRRSAEEAPARAGAGRKPPSSCSGILPAFPKGLLGARFRGVTERRCTASARPSPPESHPSGKAGSAGTEVQAQGHQGQGGRRDACIGSSLAHSSSKPHWVCPRNWSGLQTPAATAALEKCTVSMQETWSLWIGESPRMAWASENAVGGMVGWRVSAVTVLTITTVTVILSLHAMSTVSKVLSYPPPATQPQRSLGKSSSLPDCALDTDGDYGGEGQGAWPPACESVCTCVST